MYNVKESNIENPNFQLAANAVAMDGANAYYTWNELSQNIPQPVVAGLPTGFDYSPWVSDGHLASGGRVDPSIFPRTYVGLGQVSMDWPTTEVQAGQVFNVNYLASTPHDPSVWDVWMTTADWGPNTELNWGQMEFLGRPEPILLNGHYYFDVEIPSDRSGHHVLWVAWHRDDPVGEVFFSASDLMVLGGEQPLETCNQIVNSNFDAHVDDWSSWATEIIWENEKSRLSNIETSDNSDNGAGIGQDGIELENGVEYILDFKTSSSSLRTIDVQVRDQDLSVIHYMDDVIIGPQESDYSYRFTNNGLSTQNATLEFLISRSSVEIIWSGLNLR